MKAHEPRRRSRSNDGHRSVAAHILPAVYNAALFASCVEEFKRRAARIFHGPKPPGGAPAVVLSDEQVLELRRMRHWRGMTVRQICEATGLAANSIVQIVNYKNRVHLDPGPRPAPESV